MKTFMPLIFLAVLEAGQAIDMPPAGCTLEFSTQTWWPLYGGASGIGTIRCRTGQAIAVDVIAKGPGLRIDHWKIRHGTGRYSRVRGIEDLLGHFVPAGNGVQLVRERPDDIPEDGRAHLALGGKEEGVELDQAISDLRVQRRHE